MTQTVELMFMSGSRDGEMVLLESASSPPSVSIGRTAPCELVIADDPDLSRRHARIVWNGSSWMLEDLGSSNGTFMGEFSTSRRISEPVALKNGEIFRVGLTRLRLGVSMRERIATTDEALVVRQATR
jgi:pSer/pThr/pTyr-binding forkhead associated (FHA) protein